MIKGLLVLDSRSLFAYIERHFNSIGRVDNAYQSSSVTLLSLVATLPDIVNLEPQKKEYIWMLKASNEGSVHD